MSSEKAQHVLLDLLSLRNALKRDPEGYEDEFTQQASHFAARFDLFSLQAASGSPAGDATLGLEPSSSTHKVSPQSKAFGEVIDFLSHCLPLYPNHEIRSSFCGQLLFLLQNFYDHLDAHLRKVLVQSLILLRNRKVVTSLELLPTFFQLFQCPDKTLRATLYSHILNDLIRCNTELSQKQNTQLRNFMYHVALSVADTQDADKPDQFMPVACSTLSRKAVSLLMDLYRRRVWNDPKTANVLAETCFSEDGNIVIGSLRFFIDIQYRREEEEAAGESVANLTDKVTKLEQSRNSKTGKKDKKLKRMQERKRKAEELVSDATAIDGSLFGALEELFSPQRFAERLFAVLRTSKHPFETRLLYMNVISRTLACHKVYLGNFFPFMQKYMRPHQKYVTQILAYCVQAVHEDVPVEEPLQGILKCLCDEFISDRSGPESMAVGLNAVRMMCSRQPEVMTQEVLNDLVLYKKDRHKSVVVAARGLIGVFREKNPELLHKRDRGRPKEQEEPESDPEHQEHGEDESDEESVDEYTDHSAIIDPLLMSGYQKRRRQEIEERREEIKEKGVYGAKIMVRGGSTNDEKVRLKPFQMTKYSKRVRDKIAMSLTGQMKKKSSHVTTMSERSQHKRRKRRH